ncbi:MAG TPA: group II intron reverse transcriptase/maturase [Candidatus Binatia bacterium]|nr:group II intron reverse transcriptase/maturase [Candidatus Binatia bacterium]
MDTAHILKIQEELAQQTLANPTRRHKRLYRLVCDGGWLGAGLETVLTNQGSNTPGVDGVTKRHIDQRTAGRERLVQELHEELLAGDYRPQPVKRVYIPKANGKWRPLGIATLRDRVVQATVKMVLEPIYESVFHPFSWGFRPLRSTHHALSALRRGPADPKLGFKWVIEGDIAACFDEIDHRLLRRFLKKRLQDESLLDLVTRLLRCGIWEDGQVTYPPTGTAQGSVVSPLLANVFLHEFDDWYVRTYRVRPAWAHLAASSWQYRRKKEVGGTLMLTRYADDWVALWNGSRDRAEEIKAEIKAFLAHELRLRLSEEKTLITHIDEGFDFLGYRIEGGKRWTDGQWCLFSRVPQKAIRRFRDAVKSITSNTFTDEVAAWTALAGLIRGWGNYYAYAAESRLMDSLDAFIHREVWKYCLAKTGGREKWAYAKYTLPRPLRETGYFQLGVVAGEHIVRLPRLSSIPRKALKLSYPPPAFLLKGRDYTLPSSGPTDERWWDQQVWGGQEGSRIGQRRLAVEVLARDATCRVCEVQPSEQVHHQPPWREQPKHNPKTAMGVCVSCHRQTLQHVVKSNGELR